MRNRRKANRRILPLFAGVAGAVGLRLWAKLAYRPIDSLAVIAAAAGSLIIVVNAAFLQSGAHPAPFFANPAPTTATDQARAKPADPAPAKPTEETAAVRSDRLPSMAAANPAHPSDPIAEFIGLSSRVQAVQRILTEHGYGRLKTSGIVDDATSAAIEKFEREHQLPVTGQFSDRLVTALTAMTGHPIE